MLLIISQADCRIWIYIARAADLMLFLSTMRPSTPSVMRANCEGTVATKAASGKFLNFSTHHRGRILTGGQLGMLFDARTGEVIHRHHSPLNCAAVSKSDESVLFVGTYTGEVLSFDSELRFMAAERLHTNAVKGLALAGNRLFSVCATGDVAVHDAVSMRCIRHVAHAHSKIANAACTLRELALPARAAISRCGCGAFQATRLGCFRHRTGIRSNVLRPTKTAHALLQAPMTGR